MKAAMKKFLNGMFWNDCQLSLSVPHAGTTETAIAIFEKNLASITWHHMSLFEQIPATLSEIEAILHSRETEGVCDEHRAQILNYADGARQLMALLQRDCFALNQENASLLHGSVGKEDALTWGTFRNSDVTIHGVDYVPPRFTDLGEIARNGFSFLSEQIEPATAAVAAFLFMARSQFFHDANKRTASLMMNGVLMQSGYSPVAVPHSDAEEFHMRLAAFYATGDASAMMAFFSRTVETFFSSSHEEELGGAGLP